MKKIVAVISAIMMAGANLATGIAVGEENVIKLDTKSVVADEKSISQKLDEYMKAQEQYRCFRGSVLVSKGDKVLLSKGYGRADKEEKIENSPETKFPIGSVTKQFTAMAIVMLEQKGLLNVKDSLAKYIPDFPHGDEITLANLLEQSSGIADYTQFPDLLQSYGDDFKAKDIIDFLKKEELKFKPGTKWEYSNSGYTILGYIIEKVSKQNYGNFLKEEIFKPLGMKNTGVCYSDGKKQYTAKGYVGYENPIYFEDKVGMSIAYGAGSLYSTIEDMHIWDRALTNCTLVDKKTMDKIFMGQKEMMPGMDYGYAWMISQDPDGKTVTHGGNTGGFTSCILKNLDKGYSIIILTNADEYNLQGIENNIKAILLNQNYEIPEKYKTVAVKEETLYSYAGEYVISPGEEVMMFCQDGNLYTQIAGQPMFQLYAESEKKFYIREIDAKIEFEKDKTGKVSGIIIHQNGADIKATRKN